MKIIRKVWKDKSKNQMHITIPNDNPQRIKEGDYVEVKKVKQMQLTDIVEVDLKKPKAK